MVAEFAVFAGMGLSLVALGVTTWLLRSIARILELPFAAVEWFLHGLGFLVVLPFVLAIMVLFKGLDWATWWVGGAILLAAVISFVGGGVRLAHDLLAGARHPSAHRV